MVYIRYMWINYIKFQTCICWKQTTLLTTKKQDKFVCLRHLFSLWYDLSFFVVILTGTGSTKTKTKVLCSLIRTGEWMFTLKETISRKTSTNLLCSLIWAGEWRFKLTEAISTKTKQEKQCLVLPNSNRWMDV